MREGIVANRLSRLRENMSENACDFYLVFTADPHGSEYIDEYYKIREYLSGFTGSAGTLLIGANEAILWTDGRYYLQAEGELNGSGIELYKSGLKDVPSLFEYLRAKIKAGNRIFCDFSMMSVADYVEITDICNEFSAFLINDKNSEFVEFEKRPNRSADNVYELLMEYAGKSREDKLEGVISKLNDIRLDGFFLADLSANMWLFNLRGSDIAYNPVAFSYSYISKGRITLFINTDCIDNSTRINLQKIERENGNFELEIKEYSEVSSYMSLVDGKIIGLDSAYCNAEIYEILKGNNEIVFVKNDDIIDKAVKNETEQEMFRKYHLNDAVSMIRFIRWIKKAVKTERLTEVTAGQYLDCLRLSDTDCKMLSFDTICAYKENGAIVHYSAKESDCKSLEDRGFLLVDSGGQYPGATTDITRTVALGELTYEEKLHYTLVLKGVLRLMDTVFPEGTTGANLDIIAREPLWKHGLDYRHGTGHGIGACLNVHEGPQTIRYLIPKGKTSAAFKAGMVTSDEPGVYIEGSHGIRIENQLLCVEKKITEWGRFLGFECLTLVPFEKDAVLADILDEDEKRVLNQYNEMILERVEPLLGFEEAKWLKSVCAEIS